MCVLVAACPSVAGAQPLSQRGFVEGSVFAFPQPAPNDPTQLVGDVLAREELFAAPAPWLRLAAGIDARANSHDQVEDAWSVDVTDRTVRRPRLSLRRASATLTHGPFTLDAGKQFIRWGRADVVTPTDRFAPRDFLNVFDNEFLAVSGVHGTVESGAGAIEAVWTRFTPARVPLADQRWTVLPPDTAVPPDALPRVYPERSQIALRFNHTGGAIDWSAAYFDGNNYLPNVDVTGLSFPPMRMAGGDAAVPTRWFTIKGEAAYFASSSPTTDEYVLYVVQIERQHGEWVFVGGYAGEAVTDRRSTTPVNFAFDRGLTHAVIGRASYTIDVNRSFAIEAAVRAEGGYARVEYSRAYGQHWRATIAGVGIAGDEGDFIGQYHRNSHATAALRYSF
ncbi:MAG TPA: hypothetical protein VFA27_00625 [Vicinamibacterales bacterium]|nr:hypothetical protein [Vicinamibacterales bacterium]